MACENFRDVYHFSNIRTCSTVELLTLSTLLLSISYLIVISSGFFVWCSLVFFFFCPGCTESSVSWQNFLSARLNPLLPLSCFRKSPRSQMTRGGKETFTMMWEIPSQGKRSKRIGIRAHSARSQAREGPPSIGLGWSMMGATLPHWEPSEPGSSGALKPGSATLPCARD